MEIRLAMEDDAKSVADIIKRHSQSDYMGYVTFDESYVREKMKKNNFYFIASDAQSAPGRVVGCVRASIVDLDLAEIRTLCVDEDHRGKGIAQRLLDHAVSFLREKKMRKIVARSKADNDEALNLFKKSGFEQEGYFKEHYRKGMDIIQLAKFV